MVSLATGRPLGGSRVQLVQGPCQQVRGRERVGGAAYVPPLRDLPRLIFHTKRDTTSADTGDDVHGDFTHLADRDFAPET